MKGTEPDLPPLGFGLDKVILALPATTKSLAGTLAVNTVVLVHAAPDIRLDGLAQDVGSAVPFHSIVTPSWKFDPYAMIMVAAAPTCTVEGAIAVSLGTLAGMLPPPPPFVPPELPHPITAQVRIALDRRKAYRTICTLDRTAILKANYSTRHTAANWAIHQAPAEKVLAAKGYRYRFVFARNAGHVDHAMKGQTLLKPWSMFGEAIQL